MVDLLHLAIDTSTSRPTAALLQGERVLANWVGPETMRHHETLLAGIHECLSQGEFTLKDLGYLSVGVGPGMFTGLRIGITTAKFLAAPLGIPCVAVSSLLALALQAKTTAPIWAVSDAKSRRVYALRVTDFSPDYSSTEEGLAAAPEIAAEKMQPGDFLLGEGAELYRSFWPEGVQLAGGEQHILQASSVGILGARRYALGLTCSSNEVQPTYLKTL